MGLLAQRYSTGKDAGKIEKRDPLPAGRYWIDLFGDEDIHLFDTWVANNAAWVEVLRTDVYEKSVEETVIGEGFGPTGKWVLFRLTPPMIATADWGIPWGMAKQIGWPNTAPETVQGSEDTIDAPKPEPGFFGGPGFGGDWEWPTWVPWAVGGGVVVVGLVVWSSLRGK